LKGQSSSKSIGLNKKKSRQHSSTREALDKSQSIDGMASSHVTPEQDRLIQKVLTNYKKNEIADQLIKVTSVE